MNACIFKNIYNDPTPNLEKICSTFLHFTHGHLILVHGFEHGKVHFKKNNYVQFWIYVCTFLLTLCVTLRSDEQRTNALECVDNVFLKGGSSYSQNQTQKRKEKSVWLKGGINTFSCTK